MNKSIFDYLDKYSLTELRIVAGYAGVRVPSHFNRNILIEEIIDVISGKKQAYDKAFRGRPNKNNAILKEHCVTIIENLSGMLNKNIKIAEIKEYKSVDTLIEELKEAIGISDNKKLIIYFIKKFF